MGRVYDIVVVPIEIAVRLPVDPIVAIAGNVELHVPPFVLLPKLVVEPWHTLVVPLITEGKLFTVIVLVATHPVDNV